MYPTIPNCLPTLPAALLAALAAGMHTDVVASCWVDANLEQRVRQLAQERFPVVAQSMPSVIVCGAEHVAPNVGGQYNSGRHEIAMPSWQLGRPFLDTALPHELGHAQVSLTGADGGLDGHGRGWIDAMVNAGLGHEAARVAGYNADAEQALSAAQGARHWDRAAPLPAPMPMPAPAQADGSTYFPPAGVAQRKQIVSCAMEQRGWVQQVDGRGRMFLVPQWAQVCRQWR